MNDSNAMRRYNRRLGDPIRLVVRNQSVSLVHAATYRLSVELVYR